VVDQAKRIQLPAVLLRSFRHQPQGNYPMLTEFLSSRDLARRLGISKSTVERMRAEGSAPPFHRISGGPKQGRVGYAPADVEQWLANRRLLNVSETPRPAQLEPQP
jgi:predicted DNA-binding transcriptional regulator AlpA